MDRRRFLSTIAAAGLSACDLLAHGMPPVKVFRPGMQEGHALRDLRSPPQASETLRCDVAILGSGVGGISAAWKLAREGWKNMLLVDGPVPGGNTAGEMLGNQACPTGAHYLPLPSMESLHVREMLADLDILRGRPDAMRPEYDESVLVHPLHERLRIDTTWHDDMLPDGIAPRERERFLALIAQLHDMRGADGRRIFVIPVELSSSDPEWRALDTLTFKDWLQREGYRDPLLHWYADYACRDDYGAGYERVSAWAGLHYFAGRNGQAANAEPGAVMTWPDGLNSLAQSLLARIPFGQHQLRRMPGVAVRVTEHDRDVEVLVMQGSRAVRIEAKHVICAMPLHVAIHVVADMQAYGLRREHLPLQAPWLVANFLLRRFPEETGNVPLAWDNVIRESRGLGYVVATHQLIRVARPERTVFTTYNALCDKAPEQQREWLLAASDADCLALASIDLLKAYGEALWPLVERVHIHLRGHAMSTPTPGYLSNAGLLALRKLDGRVRFAHADLSGYSVFEEAAWWGYRAATGMLGRG